MGCDGGTIPRRDELVKTKKKGEIKDKQAESIARWKYCALSCDALRNPIVSCPLGKLYNKESIIKYLLHKGENFNEVVTHVRNLRDVVELKLTEKPDFNEESNEDLSSSRYHCPIVGIDMNGKHKFCYLRKCGCVFSERALREVESANCLKCGEAFKKCDIIVINGTEEDIENQRKRMNEEREKVQEKLKKKAATKRKATQSTNKLEAEETTQDAKVKKTCEDKIEKKVDIKKHTDNDEKKTSNGNLTDAKSSKTKSSTTALLTEKASTSYSIAKDNKASEVYKSLFTSHETAKNKPKSHWVTYNPLYF